LANLVQRDAAVTIASHATSSKDSVPAPASFGTPGRPDGMAPHPHRINFCALRASKEFTELRRRHRRFVFPMCAAFFCWFMLFVLLAAYAHDFMIHRVAGLINVGFVLGILQFVSTGAITVVYVRFARRALDPRVAEIRRRVGVVRK